MIEISTKFNAADRRDLKKQQNLILIAGAVGASFGVVGGVLLAVLIKPIFLILLIGSAVIFCTALFFCKYLATAAEKNSGAYFTLTFDEKTLKIEKTDPSLLTKTAAVIYPLDACSVSAFQNGTYRLTAPDAKTYAFNRDGFLNGSLQELEKLLKSTAPPPSRGEEL
jgi:hypothetical protein